MDDDISDAPAAKVEDPPGIARVETDADRLFSEGPGQMIEALDVFPVAGAVISVDAAVIGY